MVSADVLDRMTDVMTHRGPDDRGIFAEDGIALGVRRLSIIDVSEGHQPFANEAARIWAVQNGEIYNHDAIRSELAGRGHRLQTRCDTEVIPHLYEQYGSSFSEHLRGMFAIAVWDGSARRATIVRDRLGIKPLYFAEVEDMLVFGSELKSVLASGLVEPQLDYEAIEAFLTLGFFPAPSTPLAQVRKLLPGGQLTVEGGRVHLSSYWHYPRPNPVPMSVEAAGERLLAELDEAVKVRLMSDVPLGAMLSGGIDSSVVVGLMARHMSEPVKTFSVGFVDAPEENELRAARLVAKHFGTDHHELELSMEKQTLDLSELVWFLDEPVADLSSLGFLAISRLAAEHVTVALTGQGADELLGGYRKHRAAALVGRWLALPSPLRSAAAGLLGLTALGGSRIGRTLLADGPAERLLAASGHLREPLRSRLVRGALGQLDGSAALRLIQERAGPDDSVPLAEALYLDAQLGLVDDMLHYFDRASMANSLEVRVPFLDHQVVEFAATIPSGLKVSGLETKHVLKRAVHGLVPDQIISRPKIGFFHSAVDKWFRAQADGVTREYLSAGDAAYVDMFDRDEVEGMITSQAGGTARDSYTLLAILLLEVWLKTYLPRAIPSRPSLHAAVG